MVVPLFGRIVVWDYLRLSDRATKCGTVATGTNAAFWLVDEEVWSALIGRRGGRAQRKLMFIRRNWPILRSHSSQLPPIFFIWYFFPAIWYCRQKKNIRCVSKRPLVCFLSKGWEKLPIFGETLATSPLSWFQSWPTSSPMWPSKQTHLTNQKNTFQKSNKCAWILREILHGKLSQPRHWADSNLDQYPRQCDLQNFGRHHHKDV